MKTALLAAGLAALLLSGPAHASWAENSNMRNPVFTGTDARWPRPSIASTIAVIWCIASTAITAILGTGRTAERLDQRHVVVFTDALQHQDRH